MSKTHDAITESAHAPTALVVEDTDADCVVIKNVRVLNQKSRNGGLYESQAIQSAAKLANRLPLSLEHTDGQGRKYIDRVGQLRNARVIEGGAAVEADAWINKGDPRAERIKIDARQFPENICLSVEVPPDGWLGEDTRKVDGKYRVRDILRMDDCSIVARGGTTSTLFESLRPPHEEKRIMSQQDISEAVRTELQEADARKAAIAEREKIDKELTDARSQVAKLQEELNAMKAAEAKRARVAAIIAQAKELGAGEITEAHAETLVPLDEAATKAIFEREATLLKGQSQQSSNSNHQPPSISGKSDVVGDQWAWVGALKS